jgi:hypothetical protein
MSKAYIAQLKARTAEVNLRSEETKKKRQHADPRVLCDKPLTEQIEELMLSLPPAQRDRLWSMEDMCARLKGRYSLSPHPMNVGLALRALGWTQKRDWSVQGAGRRVWQHSQK